MATYGRTYSLCHSKGTEILRFDFKIQFQTPDCHTKSYTGIWALSLSDHWIDNVV